MRLIDITSTDSDLNEAPAGFFKQGLKKIGAKAAAKVGMKGTAASLAQQVDTGASANQLKVDLQGYLGGIGGSLKKLDATELKAFLASKKMPTNSVPASGIVPPKELDNILLKTLQQSKKVTGAPAVGAKQDPSAIGSGTAPAGAGQAQGGAPAQSGGQAPAPNDANNDGKDDTTGKVIPMKKPGAAPAAGGQASAGIPDALQTQLDALTPTEKKALAGLI